MTKPTYDELVAMLQRIDHHLAVNDAIHYKDKLAHELEDLLDAAGAHYDSRPPEPKRAIPYSPAEEAP